MRLSTHIEDDMDVAVNVCSRTNMVYDSRTLSLSDSRIMQHAIIYAHNDYCSTHCTITGRCGLHVRSICRALAYVEGAGPWLPLYCVTAKGRVNKGA
jgi:hypothetical protein